MYIVYGLLFVIRHRGILSYSDTIYFVHYRTLIQTVIGMFHPLKMMNPNSNPGKPFHHKPKLVFNIANQYLYITLVIYNPSCYMTALLVL